VTKRLASPVDCKPGIISGVIAVLFLISCQLFAQQQELNVDINGKLTEFPFSNSYSRKVLC